MNRNFWNVAYNSILMTQQVLEQKVIKNPEESKSDAILSETKCSHLKNENRNANWIDVIVEKTDTKFWLIKDVRIPILTYSITAVIAEKQFRDQKKRCVDV